MSMKQAIVDEITRYRSYEWGWGLIASVVRRKHGLAMSARELAAAYIEMLEK